MPSISQGCNAVSPSATGAEMHKMLDGVRVDLASLTAQFNQLRTDFNAHVHGGITAGAANSSAPAATAAAAVTQTTLA